MNEIERIASALKPGSCKLGYCSDTTPREKSNACCVECSYNKLDRTDKLYCSGCGRCSDYINPENCHNYVQPSLEAL